LIAFLHSNNKHVEERNEENNLIHNSFFKKSYRNNLTKEINDHYNENNKTLKKEMEDNTRR
jgi:hypothetical protein